MKGYGLLEADPMLLCPNVTFLEYFAYLLNRWSSKIAKSTIEILEKGVKYIQSYQ